MKARASLRSEHEVVHVRYITLLITSKGTACGYSVVFVAYERAYAVQLDDWPQSGGVAMSAPHELSPCSYSCDIITTCSLIHASRNGSMVGALLDPAFHRLVIFAFYLPFPCRRILSSDVVALSSRTLWPLLLGFTRAGKSHRREYCFAQRI